MPRVLIANDDVIVPAYARAYHELGCDVVAGAANLDLETARYDLVHVLWPEQFCRRKAPTDAFLVDIEARLKRWAQRCPIVVTVNNFYPHGHRGNPQYKRLYEIFYEHCTGIHHFSEISRTMVMDEWPVTAAKQHRVTLGFSYPWLVKPEADREALRRELSLRPSDFVVLVVGQLRDWGEIQLLMQGLARAKAPGKRLLAVARYNPRPMTVRSAMRYARWRVWQRRHGVRAVEQFVPDEQMYRYVEAADVLVAPRLDSLNSGIPPLAMSFGKVYLAPDHGAYPELVAGTGNILYKTGDAGSLAEGLEAAYASDRAAIGRQNLDLAATWSWDRVARAGLEMTDLTPSAR